MTTQIPAIDFPLAAPAPANAWHAAHVRLLLDSYRRLLGRPLLACPAGADPGRLAFEAGFALLSHTADADPVFNYGNRLALQLFEFAWADFIGMPSRYSAEPVNREARQQLLAQVAGKGYIDDYAGVRISAGGRRFLIRRAVVWNVHDAAGALLGQAASFADWQYL